MNNGPLSRESSNNYGRNNMPNLEQAISEWRQQMLAAGIKSPIPLDELESHLRDEIEHQTTKGLNEAEAFQAAVKNIGQGRAIKTEFKKVGRTMSVREWKGFQILTLGFVTLFSLAGARQLGHMHDMASGQLILCWAALVTFLVLPWIGRMGYRFFPIIRSKRTKGIITGSGGALIALWWIVLFNFILPGHDKSGLFVILLWGFVAPTGALVGLALGLEAAARKNVIYRTSVQKEVS
ncbi:MAG: permease prefix domain 1-containing protein [Limisphaerales bacterium]